MQKLKIRQTLQTLVQILNAETRRSAAFCRSLWISIRWFRRNREYRKGIGEVLDGMPLPNPRLISNVTGIPDIAWYLVSGKLSAEDIVGILRKNDVDLLTLKSVLKYSSNNLCRAYHPYRFVSTELIRGFTLVDFSPGGAKGTPGQDLYLFRKT